jgi:hypothetical protein
MCCDPRLLEQTSALLEDMDEDLQDSWQAFVKLNNSSALGPSQSSVSSRCQAPVPTCPSLCHTALLPFTSSALLIAPMLYVVDMMKTHKSPCLAGALLSCTWTLVRHLQGIFSSMKASSLITWSNLDDKSYVITWMLEFSWAGEWDALCKQRRRCKCEYTENNSARPQEPQW